MKPLAQLAKAQAAKIRGVFLDIDDTLTSEGRLTATAYTALENLQRCGLLVAPITGRPAGWCDHMARMWPVDAVVGENGAFYFRYEHDGRRMQRHFWLDAAQRAEDRRRLDKVKSEILSQVAGAAVSADQRYRECDLAIDFCEDVVPLSDEQVQHIVLLFEKAGAQAKVSSIHVNGWFGDYDKLSMTRRMMQECFDVDLDSCRDDYLFIGDSPNDGPMFQYFPLSVGVANIERFRNQMSETPAFVTGAASGAGFAEAVSRIIESRA
ncbi:MAG TPA: HAD-IIB family hydrolase [Gammaproteobacteria bacterium]